MNEQPTNNKQHTPPPGFNLQGVINLLITGIILTFILNWVTGLFSGNSKLQITYDAFIRLVESGSVSAVQLDEDQLLIQLAADADIANIADIIVPAQGDDRPQEVEALQKQLQHQPSLYTGRVEDPELVNRLLAKNIQTIKPINKTSPMLSFIASWVLPLILIYFIYRMFMRTMSRRMGEMGGSMGGMGGMMGVGKSKARLYNVEESTGVTFADVAGQDEAKESLDEMVDYLHNPEKYQRIGALQPKGALLVGPPGTGKTLLAKAVAGEAKVPFFSLSGSEFVEMFVGVGASRVRDLFQEAAKQAPCIIFIDEIDAIGKSRDNQMSTNDEREQTLNQLLAEMDGFDSSKGVVILAATNRPEILDKALLRPGRFDRRVIVEKPDLPGREAILAVHAKKVQMGENCDLREIALATSGATGADLANIINEAALRAVRLQRETVLQEDMMEAVEVVIAGKEKKDRIMNPKEKRMVAFHEVGHALVTALQKDGTPVQKITIIPRTMGSLGYTMSMPEEERYLMTRDDLLAEITTLLGGRAAEQVEFQQSTTGASNDIERATQLARGMVTQYGMSDTFGMMGLESIQNKYLDGRNVATCADATGAAVDEEVRGILQACYDKAVALLNQHKGKLQEIAEFLYSKETITGTQFMEILGADEPGEM